MDVELLQFRYSHYNEKVRWALDWKGIPHRRVDLLPGLHRGRIRKLTGQTSTPVLKLGDWVVAGSAAIIDRLEHQFPDAPSLYPADSRQRDRALEFQRHFDLVLGPAARLVAFAAQLDDARCLPDLFSEARPPLERLLYRTLFPVTRRLMRRAYGVDVYHHRRTAEINLEENLAAIERSTKRCFYLAGGAFSVADLTAASLLAPLVVPPYPDTDPPGPKPAAWTELIERVRARAAGEWALEMYRRHRAHPQSVMNEPLASATTSAES
jgi:glutathione S-transferase